MTEKRPTMPDSVDRETNPAETQPADGQRQGELGDGSGSDSPAAVEAAGTGDTPAADNAKPPAPGAEASPDAAQKRGAEAGGESPTINDILLVARHLSGLVEEHGRLGRRLPRAASENTVQSVETPGGSAAERRGQPEQSSDKAPEPQDSRRGVAVELTTALRTFKADFAQWVENEKRSRRRWAGLAMSAGFPACLLLGLLVELQFQVIPLHDPTRGWGDHIWNTYGRTIVDCELEAMRTHRDVDCPLLVRRP